MRRVATAVPQRCGRSRGRWWWCWALGPRQADRAGAGRGAGLNAQRQVVDAGPSPGMTGVGLFLPGTLGAGDRPSTLHHMPGPQTLPRLLIRRLPFFYGWVILAATCCAGFARAGGGVAVLSIFVAPMTAHFGWSRTAISGAASVGGLIAALASPRLGRLLDRAGARLILSAAVLTTALACMALSLTQSLAVFYALYCVIRMNFAGPFDLGIYGAVNNWFVARRAAANAIATAAQMVGLVALPLIAQGAIVLYGSWRAGWVAVGVAVLAVGFLPSVLLIVRAPEDVGLRPDRRALPALSNTTDASAAVTVSVVAQTRLAPELHFTRGQALRTRAFWLLALFTVF